MKKCLEIAQKLENEVLNKIQKFANEAQVTSNYMNLILASQKINYPIYLIRQLMWYDK